MWRSRLGRLVRIWVKTRVSRVSSWVLGKNSSRGCRLGFRETGQILLVIPLRYGPCDDIMVGLIGFHFDELVLHQLLQAPRGSGVGLHSRQKALLKQYPRMRSNMMNMVAVRRPGLRERSPFQGDCARKRGLESELDQAIGTQEGGAREETHLDAFHILLCDII
jgi:hypothetical protein